MITIPEFTVLSVMGPHAGEDADAIFTRKIADIQKAGMTFWLVRSHKAKPDMVQTICSQAACKGTAAFCLFLSPSSQGGATPTKMASAASEYSADLSTWHALPPCIGPVTGLITKNACALVFDNLTIQESALLDLWQYADFFSPARPIMIRQGASTVCALRKNMQSHPERMKSNLRSLVAVGRLAKPYAVWLR